MTEAISMMEWLRHRAIQCRSSSVLRIYQKQFVQMWKDEFGTTDTIPKDFKNEIDTLYREYKDKEKDNEQRI